jgi:hypothetical protein
MPSLYNATQIANELQLSPAKFRQLVKRRSIPRISLDKDYYELDAVMEFFRQENGEYYPEPPKPTLDTQAIRESVQIIGALLPRSTGTLKEALTKMDALLRPIVASRPESLAKPSDPAPGSEESQ